MGLRTNDDGKYPMMEYFKTRIDGEKVSIFDNGLPITNIERWKEQDGL